MPRAQFPIVGGSYNGISVDANPQRSINLYPEYDKTGGRQILRGTPGLSLLTSLSTQTTSTEHIANGSFANGETDWTLESQWSIADGVLSRSPGNGEPILGDELLDGDSWAYNGFSKITNPIGGIASEYDYMLYGSGSPAGQVGQAVAWNNDALGYVLQFWGAPRDLQPPELGGFTAYIGGGLNVNMAGSGYLGTAYYADNTVSPSAGELSELAITSATDLPLVVDEWTVDYRYWKLVIESSGGGFSFSGNLELVAPAVVFPDLHAFGIVGPSLKEITGYSPQGEDTASQIASDLAVSIEAGVTYKVTFDVNALSGDYLTVTLGGTTSDPILTTGSKTIYLTATDTTGLIFNAGTNLTVEIDNVSVETVTTEEYQLRGLLPIDDEYLYAVYGPYLRRFDGDYTSTTLNEDEPMGSSEGLVTMAHIKYSTGHQIMICDGSDRTAYLYDTTTENFTVVDDDTYDFQGGGSVAVIDDTFLSHGVGSDRFYISGVGNGLSWDATDDSRAAVKTSDIQRVYVFRGLVWVFKEDSIEIFVNTGSSGITQPVFQRTSGGSLNVGCIAPWSIASIDSNMLWLANDRTVKMAVGQNFATVSSPQLSHQIENFGDVTDAVAYCYTEDGHFFYVLTFPSADVTYVYDISTQEWHERQSYDPDSETDGRHRSYCYAYFQDRHVVGDFANTKLYSMDNDVYTEDGNRILRQRITRNVNEDNLTAFFHRFELHMEGGVGLLQGQGSNPQVMMNVSKDGGHTWLGPRAASIGARGGYDVRAYWTRLGQGRDLTVWVSVSDPVKVIMLGAYLDYEQGYA